MAKSFLSKKSLVREIRKRGGCRVMLRGLFMENLKLGSCLSSTFTVLMRVQFFGWKVAAETAAEVPKDVKEGHFAETAAEVPKDVKEGHFAVVAVEGEEEAKRFIVELSCLSDPAFLKLLEKAEEEFGFQQEGVLSLPCKPDELKRITSKHNNNNNNS